VLEKFKKHTSKILIFVVNLLVMAIAVLIIKNKDWENKALKAQNNLLNEKESLSSENENLNIELNSLRGVVEEISAQDAILENATISEPDPALPSTSADTNAPVPILDNQNSVKTQTGTSPSGTTKKNSTASGSSSSSKSSKSSSSSSKTGGSSTPLNTSSGTSSSGSTSTNSTSSNSKTKTS
jgi:hypothetical protein